MNCVTSEIRLVSKAVAEVMNRYNARLWHAHYLFDVIVYKENEGICARNILTKMQGYTDFHTDATDKAKGLFDKVFFNLSDQGISCKKGNGLPNAYGPISFLFQPDALNETEESIVLSRSVSRSNGNLQFISRVEDVSELFKEEGSPWLSEDYKHPEVIACADHISLDHLIYIQVDPIEVDGILLKNVVQKLFPWKNVRPRQFAENGSTVYSELIDWIIRSEGKLETKVPCPDILKELVEKKNTRSVGRVASRQSVLHLWADRVWLNVVQTIRSLQNNPETRDLVE